MGSVTPPVGGSLRGILDIWTKIFIHPLVFLPCFCCILLRYRAAAQTATSTLPAGWTAAVDPTSGRTYYVNATTGQTSWEVPTETPATSVAPVATNAAPVAVSIVSEYSYSLINIHVFSRSCTRNINLPFKICIIKEDVVIIFSGENDDEGRRRYCFFLILRVFIRLIIYKYFRWILFFPLLISISIHELFLSLFFYSSPRKN